jgi:LmbE family N-acetylglucosaminyl deacetylase
MTDFLRKLIRTEIDLSHRSDLGPALHFHKPSADIFVPDGLDPAAALERTTHLCIAAHQDDIEIMAYHGIAACFGLPEQWFTGVVVTNGAGSPRNGIYGSYTDDQMQKVRLLEQRKAAYVGDYACQLQLGFTSSEVKDPRNPAVVDDLKRILLSARPEIVYLHNLADKHDTHIAVTTRAIAALRAVREDHRPKKVYGCEVWRDLDWLSDEEKQVLSVSARPNLAASLVGVFDSQVTGGKRYDLATAGRRLAHATYYASHGTDEDTALTFAMDLTPLVEKPDLPLAEYVAAAIDRFRADVERRVASFL